MHSQRLVGFLFAVGLACAVPARAQSATSVSGFELPTLALDPSGMSSLVVGSARVMGAGTYRATAGLAYLNDPLVAIWNGTRIGSIVRDRVVLQLTGTYALFDRAEIAAQVPVVLMQRGDELGAFGIAAPAAAGLGSPWVLARANILEDGELIPFDLGAQLGVAIPVGSADALASSLGFVFAPKLLATKAVGGVLATGEVGLDLGQSVPLGVEQIGPDMTIGAAALLEQPLASVGGLRPEVAVKARVPFTGQLPSVETMVGGRVPLPAGLNAFALFDLGFGKAPGTPRFAVNVGVSFDNAAGAPKPARRTKAQDKPSAK